MIDRPLVRRTPVIDPSEDQWMLDHWSVPKYHVVTVVYWDRRVPIGNGRTTIEREFREVCTCGWRSIEYPGAHRVTKCPVLDALEDRLRRLRRPTERIEWVPYVPPHVEPDPRD